MGKLKLAASCCDSQELMVYIEEQDADVSAHRRGHFICSAKLGQSLKTAQVITPPPIPHICILRITNVILNDFHTANI